MTSETDTPSAELMDASRSDESLREETRAAAASAEVEPDAGVVMTVCEETSVTVEPVMERPAGVAGCPEGIESEP